MITSSQATEVQSIDDVKNPEDVLVTPNDKSMVATTRIS